MEDEVMFYDTFENLCKSYGTSPAQIRRELDIKQSTMAMWKSKGLTPNAVTLARLADYFGVTTEHLLGVETDLANFPWLIDVLDKGIPESVRNDPTGLRQVLSRAQTQLDQERKRGLKGGIQQWEKICDCLTSAIDERESNANFDKLALLFDQLNSTGQRRACEWITELTKIPEYQRVKPSKK